jgi:hypothetical protein
MTGYKYYSKESEALWSCQIESARKDVERSFGILKGRFRCLKLPILFHKQKNIDNMFFTCVILHNMILEFDGRDKLWEEDVDWNGVDGDHFIEEDWPSPSVGRIVLHRRAFNKLNKRTDYSTIGRRTRGDTDDIDPKFVLLRKNLINHYYYVFKNKLVEWLN